MGYSVAVGRAKAKANAKPTSAPAVACKGGASSSSGQPEYQGPVSEHPLPKPKSKSIAKKKPPNPPLAQKCTVPTDFPQQGSTAYAIKKTCSDCGHSTVERREDIWEYPFQDCPHEQVDHRGCSKSTFRTFCKQCGCFINEIPIQARRQRVAVALRVEETTESTLSVVANITSPEASNRFPNSDVQAILHILCQNLIDSGEKSAAELHEELDNAIVMHFAQQDIDPEAYPQSSDGGEDGFHGWDEGMNLAELAGPSFMAVTANQITGDVLLSLPEVDIMDPNDPNIYDALDRDLIAPVLALNGERCAMRS